ncbi:PTS fructose transporter subunit IIC, partial [Klebsiella pneumoniae]|nr:PTS fructose transporter subunit IIC [Klebsiella pneumoniae]
ADRFIGKPVLDVPVARGIRDAEALIQTLINKKAPIYGKKTAEKTAEETDIIESGSAGRKIYKHLMNGVSHMLPFVVGGGVLIAISFLFGIHSADPKHPSYNAFAELLNKTGAFGFQLMVPILSAYIADSMAKRPGLI